MVGELLEQTRRSIKVLFLDFDGVITCIESMLERGWVNRGMATIDPTLVARINQIVEATGAKIVVSSTWRIIHPIGELVVLLREKGFIGQVIGCTPKHVRSPKPTERSSCRGDEIQAWIDNSAVAGNDYIEAIAILDDDEDMAHLEPFLIKTSFANGIQPEHVQKTIEMLNRTPTKEPS